MFELFSSASILAIIFCIFATGAIGSLALYRNDKLSNIWSNISAILGSSLSLTVSTFILTTGKFINVNIPTSFKGLGISFTLDYLSAFFVFIISLVALICSIYAMSYIKQFFKKYNIGTLGFFYNLFILGMLMVVTASNVIFFMIAWEIMTLASYFLVIFENKEHKNIKAGTTYFIMAHIGAAFIMLAFLLLATTAGSFEFSAIKLTSSSISPLILGLVFISVLIGFGIKAGIIPLHIWLPSAHPAAPSHVSALMSGVMIKTGIYMFIRIFFDLIPTIPLWWGIIFLILGSIAALLGVLYALAEHDLKRLLAYHSIENIGIILLGIGSSLVLLSINMKFLATIGLFAALYHTLNHAVFKALLFLGAGSVISKTGTKNIEDYGGLIRYMPLTAFFFLIGSLAISALPPLNGFFSEWLTFQSLFNGLGNLNLFTQIIFILSAGSLAFTGGLAAACFVKAFGATFLARPRSEKVKSVKESAFSMQLAMGILASLTLILGVFAGNISKIISKITGQLENITYNNASSSASFKSVSVDNSIAKVSMPTIFICIVIAIVTVIFLVIIYTRRRKVVYARTWDCGTDLTPRMEITASSFSSSIISVFKNVLKPTRQTSIEYHDANLRYFPKNSIVHFGISDIYTQYIYKPLLNFATKLSINVRKIQSGNINSYILYLFITLLGILVIITN